MNSRRFHRKYSPFSKRRPVVGLERGAGPGSAGNAPASPRKLPLGKSQGRPERGRRNQGAGGQRAGHGGRGVPAWAPWQRVSAPRRQTFTGEKRADNLRRWKDPELTSSYPAVFHGGCNSSLNNSGGTSQSPSEAAQSAAGEPRAPPGAAAMNVDSEKLPMRTKAGRRKSSVRPCIRVTDLAEKSPVVAL